ncbi:transcriptional regulator [Sporolactobacillus sp. THM7-4]|nr:transcriptional regulator [Sporolactobacillus sp. THM7-4]
MTCLNKRFVSLMNKVLDGEARREEKMELDRHMETCESCRNHFRELKQSTELLNHLSHPQLPFSFTKNVLDKLPAENRHALREWMSRHPVWATAAICALPMSFVMIAAKRQTFFQGKNGEDHGYLLLRVPEDRS